MKIASIDEMRFMDRYAIEKLDIARNLMENAGIAAVSVLQSKIGIRDKNLSSFAVPAITAVTGGRRPPASFRWRPRKSIVTWRWQQVSGSGKTNFAIIARLPIE